MSVMVCLCIFIFGYEIGEEIDEWPSGKPGTGQTSLWGFVISYSWAIL